MTDRRELDRDLDRLLRENNARVDMVSAREILRGVLAAPDTSEAQWLTLIAPGANADVIAALNDLNTRIRASLIDDGLSRRTTDPERIQALRQEMKRRDLDAFIVPKADEHQGEFIARRSERLQWLTAFTGSAGSAVVMTRKAAIFVDGRYTLQVKKQVTAKLFEAHHATVTSQATWLADNLSAGMRVGFDPWLITDNERKRLEKITEKAGAYLVALSDNPIDAVWTGQPASPISPMLPHPAKYAGETSQKKRQRLLDAMAKARLDTVVLTAPDSIAWLLNIRGADVPCTPISLGFAVVHSGGGIELFTDPRKMSPGLEAHLGPEVVVMESDALASELGHLGSRNLRIGVDLAQAAAKIPMTLRLAGADVINTPDLIMAMKARKNTAERDGMRNAHLRDGIAMVRFLSWLERSAGKGKITEWDVGLKIDALRTELDLHRGPSFQTIAGYGANGAIVHYRAAEKTSATLKKGSLLLVDSGGQFLDGTTDVTRTIAIGKPTAEMRDRYTRVLKGHIQLAAALFPEGTSGSQLDALARKPLWDVGLDYEHGTGHGVGSYLGVHEGPQRISKHPSTVALEPGMVVSNEPGYYKTGGYGIRIENLVMVCTVKPAKGWERKLLGFDTLTCAPYDINLIEPKLLSTVEVDWLNTYHAWVLKSLEKNLEKTERAWLQKATKRIKAGARGA
jgi:Xaa-Pro aminopeptidase